jgi:hypothetical protein
LAGLRGPFFDTGVLVAGLIDFGPSSRHALLLMDAVADGRIERPPTAWHCCLEFYSVTTRLPRRARALSERRRSKKKVMVDQLRASWNSLLRWLREAQAWSLAAEAGIEGEQAVRSDLR